MRSSIRIKISVCIIVMFLIAIFSGGLLVSRFLPSYYIDTKATALKSVEKALEDYDVSDTDDEYNLNTLCETKGVTFVAYDIKYNVFFGFGPIESMNEKLSQFMSGSKNSNIKETLIEETDDYKIIISTDLSHDKAMHLEMYGKTEDGNPYMMSIAMSNILDSIRIVNRFYVSMLGIITVILFAGTMLITRMLTKPILQLAGISQRMAKLDFDAKYRVDSNDEIGILGKSINEMSKELESTISELKSANIELQKDIDRKNEIENMRNDFISNVSHELKTPIALIQGYAEGLKDGITDDPESREFYCDVIIDEAAKMNKMVKNLLTLNQLEFGNEKVVMERFDVAALIRGLLISRKISAQQAGVSIVFEQEGPVLAWGDEFLIEEVLTNYITNAFNHVDGKKLIKVQIIQKDDIVRVSVFNTGRNIPEEDIEHIWEKFYKVDKARTREYGGNGIGLSIVKAIMKRIGKECGVINREDGVEFWFEMDAVMTTENMLDDERN